ncbi:uncharacterized protein FIBRA_04423 [Fibroporia radiculosa]|uniref:F-box/LRR-repeat protein 15-like leucin rich repeat domain-containing protein n=1 Tax=Fibroporia radiculosa TaxID=599839 RepID=J4IA57_9APHY|nr:uncharacterized protein FIBRA_04423 [Fibroporia radiculosa]CCM02331.1 predicted protein [Fibroporia radiculosa]
MSLTNRLPLTEDSCYDVVRLELTRDDDHGIIDDDLAHILPWCPNLESVRLTGVPDLTDRTIILLGRVAPDLLELDISGCTQVTDEAILSLATSATELQVVKLNGLTTLTDPSVSTLARSLMELKELELCDVPLLTAACIRDIWTFSTKLKYLKLNHCARLTDKAFPHILPPSSPASGATASALSPPLSPAQYAVFTSRPASWLDTLTPLVFSSHHNLANLRQLELEHCVRLSDAAISGIVNHAPRIRHLSLSGCMTLTDVAARAIASLGAHLNVLTLAHVEEITDYGIVSIVGACPRLRTVDLSFNARLTDLTLLELATLPQLERLTLVGLTRLTDNAVFFLAEHTTTLERLQLSLCKRLSLEAFHVLVRKLPKLEQLSASGVPALKRIGVDRFSERVPRGYNVHKHGIYRVYRGGNLRALARFLDKEQARRREAERENIIFKPRADDSVELY